LAEEKKSLGIIEPGEIRRIGYSHAILMPARSTVLVDINSERNELARTEQTLKAGREQIALLERKRDQLQRRIAEFEAAPIDRVDGDPDVPVISPQERAKAEQEQDAKANAEQRARDEKLRELSRQSRETAALSGAADLDKPNR
jgi:predicted RNase H-like nuclease (RuvC/YqgF family)